MTEEEKAADEYAEKLWNTGNPRDWAWSDTRKDFLAGFLAGAEWMRKQFTLFGTDECLDCDDGRATLYTTHNGRCIECANKQSGNDSHSSHSE